MEQNISSSAYGTTLFKVKYRTVELQTAPAFTATSLGTLKRGAVVTVLEDTETYHYKVRLDNQLEGYVYKAAGEITSGLAPTKLPAVEAPKPNSNGTYPTADIDGSITKSKPSSRTPTKQVPTNKDTEPPVLVFGNLNTTRSTANTNSVIITTGEIAALDSPGIVGRQVGKLRRGDVVSIVSQDNFFYQVSLPNGSIGYIPRYTAEPKR